MITAPMPLIRAARATAVAYVLQKRGPCRIVDAPLQRFCTERGWRLTHVRQALDDLVADGRVQVEVRDANLYYRPVVAPDTVQ